MFYLSNLTNIHLILIICGFCIFKFAFSLKFICNTQIRTCSTVIVIHKYVHSGEKFKLPKVHVPS